jgi:AmmeMemoRadiSam system protein B/AmmeMemoRadiSam system protein A
MAVAANIRPAAVAGAFYPGDARELASDLDDMLDGVDCLEPRIGFPKALVVPHAGYIYSGSTAACAYDALSAARGIVRRVVLLGPVHRVPVRGLALPDATAFDTPLGRVPVDPQAARSLSDLPQVVQSAPAHAMEHALEVQLPFLQKVLGEFALVPFAVGDVSVEAVAQVIERLWGGPETLIVISTDLSHYHDYEAARRIDAATLSRIERFATDLGHDEACGATPLNGLLALGARKGLTIRRLAACNSGDTAGGHDRVVGYSSFALYEGGEISGEDAGRVLVGIARNALARALGQSANEDPRAAWLNQLGATFVTLTKAGRLRGCIGSLAPARTLAEDVAANALAAAFEDPRFPKLSREEWPQCEVEVSLLSAPKTIRFADEADLLEQLRSGEDGVILEHAGRRATYLPQVWELLPDKRRFLDELMKKAGFPADTRLARCKVARYRARKFHGRALVA